VVEANAEGEVVSTWSTFDHIDNARFPGDLSRMVLQESGGLDWTHANAVVYLEAEDAFLVSLRHQNWVVMVDRLTGEVIWRLGEGGDFTLSSGGWFYSQHAPEMHADGTILIYDNGNERPGEAPGFSRAVRYQLDPGALLAAEVWSFRAPFYTTTMGDADATPEGEVLIDAGGSHEDPSEPAVILSVTGGADPRVLWELRMSDALIYRATPIPAF